MNTFICHPETLRPSARDPLFMDAPGYPRGNCGIWPRRLATVGYYVLLPHLYYRSNVEELVPYIGEAHTATRHEGDGHSC